MGVLSASIPICNKVRMKRATTIEEQIILLKDRGMTIEDEPTGWEAISNPEEIAYKVLIDGILYIMRDGRMYTIQGTLVQ